MTRQLAGKFCLKTVGREKLNLLEAARIQTHADIFLTLELNCIKDCITHTHFTPERKQKQSLNFPVHNHGHPRRPTFFRSTFVSSITPLVYKENKFARKKKVWKNSRESSLCIVQPQKYKQILSLCEFGEEAFCNFLLRVESLLKGSKLSNIVVAT